MLTLTAWMVLLPLGCSDKSDTGAPDTGTAATTDETGGPGGGGDPGAGEVGAMVGMTSAHNVVRAEEDQPNIAPLTWSNALARDAQDWVDGLSATNCSFLSGSTEPGDSLFIGYPAGEFVAQDIVDDWAAEEFYYDYADDTCSPPTSGLTCDHYLQIVWAETQRLGCGTAVCEDGWEIWGCIYDPPGNTGGQPY